ncbi:MAG TPA: hypothetical protein PLP50_17720 [Thermoanaerobaculia bacterium]|nr:hypothetical protein [Thermoanaerobaculia bacterium]
MAIVAKSADNGTFVNAPQGSHQAVCCDVIDVGLVDVVQPDKSVKKVHKIDIVWQLPIVNEESGKRFTVRKRFTLSLSEKANLRKDLEAWRGKPFPKEIVETGFDVENLLGVNALLNVQHEASREGRVYANVKAIMALPQDMTPMVAVDYVRKCDRDQAPPPVSTPAVSASSTF